MMVVNASRNEGVWDIERRCEGSELADWIVGRGSVKGVNSEMEVLAESVTESEMKAKSIVVRLMVRGNSSCSQSF